MVRNKWTNFILFTFVIALLLSGMHVNTSNLDSLFVFGQECSKEDVITSFSDDYSARTLCTNELLGQRSSLTNLRKSRNTQKDCRSRREVAYTDIPSTLLGSMTLSSGERANRNCQLISIFIIISYIHQIDGQK